MTNNNIAIETTRNLYEKFYKEKLTDAELKKFIEYCKSENAIDGIKKRFNFINCYAFIHQIPSEKANKLWGV